MKDLTQTAGMLFKRRVGSPGNEAGRGWCVCIAYEGLHVLTYRLDNIGGS